MDTRSTVHEGEVGSIEDKDLFELRELLVGDHIHKIEELRKRLDDPVLRSQEVSRVLAQALSLAIQRDSRVPVALHPIIEDSLRTSVERDPALLATALFPIVGQAVRKAVAHAVQQLLDSLNSIFADGFSLKRWRWRLEAIRSGKSFGEIALARSLAYRVEQIYLIHRKTGILLAESSKHSGLMEDADLVVGMLTALQDFARDSFTNNKQDDLEVLHIGEFKVWLLHGPLAILAVIVRGRLPQELQARFAIKIEQIHKDFHAQLLAFENDGRPIAGIGEGLDGYLLGEASLEHQSHLTLKIMAATVFGLMLAGVVLRVQSDIRWRNYLKTLGQEPGVTVIDTHHGWSRYSVTGLRDPMAVEPESLLPGFHLSPSKVSESWQPYLSLDPRLAGMHRLSAEIDSVRKEAIHFEVNSTTIPLYELPHVDDVSEEIRQLNADAASQGKRIGVEIVGHTDHTGAEEHNAELSQQRAETVIQLLKKRGVAANLLSPVGVGDSQPQRADADLYEQNLDRRATFIVRVDSLTQGNQR
jgi:OOP family OmpA-OmpF porin